MIRTNRSIVLAVIVAATFLAGCGDSNSDKTTNKIQTVSQQTVTTQAAPRLKPALAAAAEVARRYALASRTWTAATYEAQYRQQLKLSAGQLHAALRQLRPTREQLQQLRVDQATSQAGVVGWPGALQPPAPSDPGVTVSRHRALLTSSVGL